MFVTILSVANLFSFLLWSHRSEDSVAQGGACMESRGYQVFQKLALAATILFAISFILSFMQVEGNGAGTYLAVYLLLFALLSAIVNRARHWLKRTGFSKAMNMVITVIIAVVLSVAMIAGIIFAGLQFDWLSDKPAAVYTTAEGWEYEIYRDEIPLTVQDLQDVTHPNYSYDADGSSSPLISHYDYRQHVWYTPGEQKLPSLDYEITEVNVQALYDFCLAEYLDDTDSKLIWGETAGYYPADAAPWGADTVYQYRCEGYAANEWILCKDNRIVRLYASWPLDAEQMAIAGQKLLGE